MNTVTRPSSLRQALDIDYTTFDLRSLELGVKPYRTLGISGLCSADCSNLHIAFVHAERIDPHKPAIFLSFPSMIEDIPHGFFAMLNDSSLSPAQDSFRTVKGPRGCRPNNKRKGEQ
jgi:hypothetical protein